MKIVLISFLYEPELGGGAAQVVYLLAHALAARGDKVTVITSSPPHKAGVEYHDGIKIIRFFPRNLYWVYEKETQPIYRKVLWQLFDIWNPFVYQTVRGFLEVEKPDLVHVHKLRGLSPSVWSAASAASVPLLAHSCHDYELVSPEGLMSGRVGRLANQRAWIMRPYQGLRARLSDQVQLASSPSLFAMNIHTRMGFFKSATCTVIPNSHGLSHETLSALRARADDRPDHPLRLLYLGRLASQKGIEPLCLAFEKSLRFHPEISLDIAGWGPQEAYLRQRFGGIRQIHFRGKVFGTEKAKLLRECDLLVLPSTALESFGIVLVEAYAYGKPVIASRIGGIPENVQDGVTGFLVAPGDVQELSQTICNAADDLARLKAMQTACFEAAVRYASEVILQRYLDLYSGIS